MPAIYSRVMSSFLRRSLATFVTFALALLPALSPMGSGVSPAFATSAIHSETAIAKPNATNTETFIALVQNVPDPTKGVSLTFSGLAQTTPVGGYSSLTLTANVYAECGSTKIQIRIPQTNVPSYCHSTNWTTSTSRFSYYARTDLSAASIGSEVAFTFLPGSLTFSGSGPYTMNITIAESSTVLQTITFTEPPVATQLFLVTQPAVTSESGLVLSTQPTIAVRDSQGETVTSAANVVTAAAKTFPSGVSAGDVTLSANTATAVSGVATFSSLKITGPPGAYTLEFTTPGLTAVTSGTITLKLRQSALSVTSIAGTYLNGLTLATTGGSSSAGVTYSVSNGSGTTGCSQAAGILSFTSAGTCLVTATKAADATYFSISSAQTTVTIAKASRTLAFAATNLNIAYGNTDTVLATPSAGAGDGSVSYSAGSSTACSVITSTGVVTATQASGTCVITATVAEGTNYLAASTTVSPVIATATRPVTFTASGATVDFGTTYQMNPLTAGLLGNHAISGATYIYQGTGSTVYGPSADEPVNAGTYSVTPSAAVFSSGLASNYSITYVAGSIQIRKVARTLSFGGTNSANLAFGNTLTVTATASAGDGSVTYSAGSSDGCSVVASTGVVTATNSSGTCDISATVADGTNHLSVTTTTSFTVTLAKRAITIAVSNLASQVGDSINPVAAVTSGSIATSDDISGVTFTYAGFGSSVYASSITKPTTAGTYLVTPSVAVFSTGSAGNYVITYSAGTLTISNRAITITASTLSLASGAALTPTFTITTGTLITGDEISGVTFTYAGSGSTVYLSSITKPTAAGSYSVTPSVAVFSTGLIATYDITFIAGTLTIQAPPASSSSGTTLAKPITGVAEVSIVGSGSGTGSLVRVTLTKNPSALEQLFVVVRLLDFKGMLIQEFRSPASVAASMVEMPMDKPMGQFDVFAHTANAAGSTSSIKLVPQTLKHSTVLSSLSKRPPSLLGKSAGKDLLFLGNSTKLTAKAARILIQVAKAAKASESRVAVTGFHVVTGRGSAYQKAVAERRALTVAKYLRAQGVDTWIYYSGLSGAKAKAIAGQPRRVEIRTLQE
jgi:outer membrane protein OmpA-like peptidoglycan-associated protein